MRKMRAISGQFTRTAKWLHWLVAFFMLSVLSAAFLEPKLEGYALTFLPGFYSRPLADRAEAIPLHASISLVVVMLMLMRLAWRRASPPPPTPKTAPGWMHKGANIGHFLLYFLIFYQGVLGIWMAALSPVDIRFFNQFNISALAPANADMLPTLRSLHFAGAAAFTLVLIGHVGAAFWHHFILRDDVLIRMLPFSGLWQRLKAPDRAREERFPSLNFHNWPKRMPK